MSDREDWLEYLRKSEHSEAPKALAFIDTFKAETGYELPPSIVHVSGCDEEFGTKDDLTLCWNDGGSYYFELIFCANQNLLDWYYSVPGKYEGGIFSEDPAKLYGLLTETLVVLTHKGR